MIFNFSSDFSDFLDRFSELSLSGLKLGKTVVDSLCQISKRLSLSGLMLGGTNIGTVSTFFKLSVHHSHVWLFGILCIFILTCLFGFQDGALQLSESLPFENQELVKLDLSFCGLTSKYFSRQTIDTLVCGIVELNLGGNLIKQEVYCLLPDYCKWHYDMTILHYMKILKAVCSKFCLLTIMKLPCQQGVDAPNHTKDFIVFTNYNFECHNYTS